MKNINIDDTNLFNEIYNANTIIKRNIDNSSFAFSDYSPIYRSTNEDITHDPYIKALSNKKRVLSIIGSGDQILNAILLGSNDIVGVDISVFPKYFLSLKLAAVKALTKDEYLEYFYGNKELAFIMDKYRIIREKLDHNAQLFWDILYNNYDYMKIYYSSLFNNFYVSINYAINHNPFLQGDNYDILKDKIDTTNIELFKYNMFDINDLKIGKFDLIILSNILNNMVDLSGRNSLSQYYAKFFDSITQYKKFLKRLPLNKSGVAITYNLTYNGEISHYFDEKEYEVYRVKENAQFFDCENEILVYSKNRKNF